MTTHPKISGSTTGWSSSEISPKSVLIVGSLVLIALTCFFTIVSGRIYGREFAPTHFALRDFVFYQIPFIRLQVSPIWRTDRSLDLSIYLMTAGLITVPQAPPSRWDLVGIMNTEDVSTFNGDAGLLVGWLTPESHGGGAEHWKKWSQQHPEAAKELWKAVQSLAERELYVLIPQLFALAERQTDAETLRAAMADYLTEEQVAMSQEFVGTRSIDKARKLLTEALRDDPENPLLNKALQELPASL